MTDILLQMTDHPQKTKEALLFHYKKFGLQRRLKVVADALKVAANVICSDNVVANSGCVCSVAVGFSAAIFSCR